MTNFKSYLLLILFLFFAKFCFSEIYERTDTLYIPDTEVLPVIDGYADDEAWEITEWHEIDQIWMPYDNDPDNLDQEAGLELWEGPDDFSGRYKILWSSETNRLYYLVEITDDVFVDGYEYPNGGYHNYDVLEIFIDEDRSGGPHIFNTSTSNAENAFAYHLTVDAPADNEVQTEFHAMDMSGTGWNNVLTMDYASHFEDFAMHKDGTKYTYEFSLIVHDDTYDHSNQEASIVELYPGKIMGLSIAYCDNDDPDEEPKQRDHFFGSVYVPLEAHNAHWENADWFGVAKLTGEDKPVNTGEYQMPNEVYFTTYKYNNILYTKIISDIKGEIGVRLLSVNGSEILRESFEKHNNEFRNQINLAGLESAVYIVQIIHGENIYAEKIVVY